MGIEHLLNKLIEQGWRPFNKDIREFFTLNEFTCGYRGEGTNHLGTIRDIVSKESLLRQFVCENGMINIPGYKNIIRQGVDTKRHKYYGKDYRYWLCESALKDESELEQFLLDNIKVEG